MYGQSTTITFKQGKLYVCFPSVIKARWGFASFVHVFVIIENAYDEINIIKEVLRNIVELMQFIGRMPWMIVVLHDVVKDKKQSVLCEHS